MYGNGGPGDGGDDNGGTSMISKRRVSIGVDSIDIAQVLAVYFRDSETCTVDEEKLLLTAELLRLFSSPPCRNLVSQAKEEGNGCFSLSLDLQQFKKLCHIDNFFLNLENNPKVVIRCMSAAVHKILLAQWETNDFVDVKRVNIRLHNYPESLTTLKNLRAAYIGKLVSVHGTVVKVSTVKPLVTQMNFDCAKCKTSIARTFSDGKFSPPQTCDSHGCKCRTFIPIRSSAQTIDFQKIRIQELQKLEDHEEGRVPRTVECELTEDLVDTCIPGDVVTITGIIAVINNYMDIGGGKSKSKNQGFYYLYVEAVSICNAKQQSAFENSEDPSNSIRHTDVGDLFSFSQKDLEFIVKFKEEYGSDVFRQILHSICPSIYGHEIVKAGIALVLFGGVRKHSMDRNKVPVRGDIHAIIVGDPGLGKSQLLQAATSISPRGIYVCGNATTNAGLTVAVVKDSMTSDYAFEAGAMVLADGGLCCIDEFDKMSSEYQALLEAMEQQCVSVAKAGLVASLSARTSVLAAANPVGGHYNRAKTVNENLKMNAALLSRFDLVFILLDKPDELLDKRVSDHIMLLHAGNGQTSPAVKKLKIASQDAGYADINATGGTLVSRLRFDPKNDYEFVPVPGKLLRKYIAYARNFVNPKMTKPAADIIQKFYLKLRDHNTSADCTPITARQLESLVRLAEARARVDLREEITVQDALDAVEIMKESLYDKFVDEHGVVDFGRSGGMSQQKEAKRFLSALDKQSALQQKDCFSISEMYSLADRIALRVPDIDTFLENLNIAGYLLKKGPKTYQVLSSSYSRASQSSSRSR
ncbi:PREDICTED: probable DNA helicase MCM8 [Tarenaya hassleriana]|uniref:probable DNA helicase MCM8 n=1 Tax=Tarenaya hassleriana TaxID=28532 RepID=UPI00053C154A|nr:PREDICTED: probable DNA helicase MCM8 [Tarenaya hassleriana]XP_010543367.1 PREDICTED: probable DNA helicase MCM8 [Tarenaya hassleriana]XP_010543368.1 PREDICTED: probable DNA helicase MCM8 [Tarenaya hassleriana]XP_010543369.1 PREDICTED: probable DNA helicase MCM8 [Tarenaya hassleriana]XP_010543370.1 PREDICTED: probable DNA helicase MCM8 [Tarenaya hassleriana]